MNRKQPIAPYDVLDLATGKQLSITEAIRGSTAMYHCNEMQFPVLILEARKVYGRIDALIEPIGGRGSKWVSALYLTDVQEKPVAHWKPVID